MEGFEEQAIERAGISATGGKADNCTSALYQKMIRWGWIDGLGRSLDWQFWNRRWNSRNS